MQNLSALSNLSSDYSSIVHLSNLIDLKCVRFIVCQIHDSKVD